MDRRNAFATQLLRQEHGGSAAEFALVLPLLVLLLAGAIDIGSMAWTKMQVAAAARAGAAYAVTKGFDTSGITSAVTSATNLAVTASTPTKTFGCPSATTGITTVGNGTTPCSSGPLPGNYVTVTASANFTPLFYWPGLSGTIALSSATKVRIP